MFFLFCFVLLFSLCSKQQKSIAKWKPRKWGRTGNEAINIQSNIGICYVFAGPNDALSPEALQAMMLGSEAISKSRVIRQELYTAIGRTKFSQQAAHASVNEGLTRKLAQTVTLTVSAKKHLQSALYKLWMILNMLVCLCFSVYFLYHHKELWSELPQIFGAQIFGTHFVLWGPIRSSTGWGILSLDICSSECNSQLHVCSTK